MAQTLEVKSEDIEKESTKTFLELKLRNIEAEIFKIARKYGITCIEELDEKLKKGKVSEEEVLDDFMELDYYEAKKDKMLRASSMNVNNKVLDLWSKYPNQYIPILYNKLKQNCLLFVGLNPSDNKKIPEELGINLIWKNREQIDIEKLLEEPLVAKEGYPYFKRFKEIADEAGEHWEHIDLFFNRTSKQKECKEVIYEKDEKLSDFAKKQLELSLELIKLANPKITVVANAFASDLLNKEEVKEKFNYAIKFDNNCGFGTICFEGEKEIPIFFSSILTGRRPLDKHSLKRLKWHIKKALASRFVRI